MTYRYALLLIVMLIAGACTRRQAKMVLPASTDTEAAFDYWIHTPIHPQADQKVSFRAKVSDRSGIVKAALYVYEYRLYRDASGLPSKKRKPLGTWDLQKTWRFAEPKQEIELSYTMPKPFGNATNVEYIFQITNSQGIVSSRFASFDAGDSPWPKDKILLYSTSPEWMDRTINIAFIKDKDFGNDWAGFLKDVEHLVYDGYHQNNMIKAHKDKWAFYYTMTEANGYDIAYATLRKEIFPDILTEHRIEGIDAFGLLHRQVYKDGAYLMGNVTFLSDNLFTSESYNIGTAVHETAHAVFNLSDEYEGCVCYQPVTGANMFQTEAGCDAFNKRRKVAAGQCTPVKNYQGDTWYMAERNVYFPTEEACHQFATTHGYGTDDCTMFISASNQVSYRSESGLCIMQDDGDAIIRDFGDVCSFLIEDMYRDLETTTASYAPAEVKENIFGYRKVVLLEFSRDGEKIKARVVDIHPGIPDKRWSSRRALTLDFCRKDKSVILQLNINAPRMAYVHNCSDGDLIKWLHGAKTYIQVPYTADLSLLQCKINFSPPDLPAGDARTLPTIEVDLSAQLQQQIKRMKKKRVN